VVNRFDSMNKNVKSPWAWVPSLYFAEGIPYAVVATTFSLIMYKRLGLSNTDAALYTSWLYLPWVIKPFWSPFVDIMKTKRWWIIAMQTLIAVGLAGVAFCIPLPFFLQSTLALLWLVAFSSATHDISADGFYMLGLSEKDQSLFVGIRSTFYRISMIVGQGALVVLAGYLENKTGDVPSAWRATFFVCAVLFALLAIYHSVILPWPDKDRKVAGGDTVKSFFSSFGSFFKKPGIGLSIFFILLFRLGEAQLTKIASPFLMDAVQAGGLGLSTSEIGFAYGTVGVIALTVGGILGGVIVSRDGLRKWLWPMVLSMNVPNLLYVYMSLSQPDNYMLICGLVGIEQFGYGFGFTAFMLYLIYISRGEYSTSHYAICTGLMALGMMLPGMFAGWLQEHIGYSNFFVWVCICTIPGMLLIRWLRIEADFGKK
jgi:PAT family beta-lactamase induction signal transducer AmpG